MKNWETIRLRCRRDGEAIKVVARETQLSPNTVRKYLRCDEPPLRKENARPFKLDRFESQIDELLRSTPKITAVRIGTYLRATVDPDIRIDESTLRKYVARRRALIVPKEAFIRAHYAPGDQAQFDFSPMTVTLAGVVVVVQLFAMRLSYSGRYFARASMRCDRPSLFAGLLAACTTFGGTPRTSIFDNATTAVKRILSGTSRAENDEFAAFRGALLLDVQFAAPAKGNEKGGVEGIHGYIEDNFFRPMPAFDSLDMLNAALADFCERDLARLQTGRDESIGARFERERAFLNPLPTILPRACVIVNVHINKFAEVQFESNRYSVPTEFAHRNACIEVYEDKIRVIARDAVVAEHQRSFDRGQEFLDIRHYLDILKHKHRAAETAAVLSDGRIPTELRALFDRYRVANPRSATKEWTKVLALLEFVSREELAQTITHACACGTDDPDAIALLVMQRKAPEIQPIAAERLPQLARIATEPISLAAYSLAKLVESAA
jgi:transposase